MTAEGQVFDSIVQGLSSLKWTIIRDDTRVVSRPDIIVESPHGRNYVIELKLGQGSAHFASIAQLDRIAAELRNSYNDEVVPLLVTTLEMTPAITHAANTVGIEVVRAAGSAAEIARSVVEFLRSHRSASDGTIGLSGVRARNSIHSGSGTNEATEEQVLHRLLNFNSILPLYVVRPLLPPPPDNPLRRQVALEDERAIGAVKDILPLELQIQEILTSDDIRHPDQYRNNLILICGPKRNRIVGEVLSAVRSMGLLDCEFTRAREKHAGQRWELRFEGRTFTSPAYEQERDFRKDPTGYAGGFTDVGLLAKLPNPWNPEAKVVVFVGIRALGTWGAASFLENEAQWLVDKVQDRDFSVIVEVFADSPEKDNLRTQAVSEIVLLQPKNPPPSSA